MVYQELKKRPKSSLKMMALPELDTRTVLDVVEENFKKLGLKAYVIRMIYIGEHTLSKEEIIKHFSKTISNVNSSYCEINVHGLLLVYDSYFVHIIEGSEDTVHRHIRFLFRREQEWIAEMNKLDQEVMQEAGEGLTVLMTESTEPKPERKMFRRLKSVMTYHSICTLAFDGLRMTDPKMEALPEVALIDFLLQSKYILPFRETAGFHRHVDDYEFFFEKVWPVPTHYTPRFLFKLKADDSFVEPLPVMPWEIVKKEGDDEEKEEREETEGSSSD